MRLQIEVLNILNTDSGNLLITLECMHLECMHRHLTDLKMRWFVLSVQSFCSIVIFLWAKLLTHCSILDLKNQKWVFIWAFYPPANLAWWNLPRTELTASMANKVIKTCKCHCCNKAITAHVFRQLGFVIFWSLNFRGSTAPSKSLCLGQLAWAYLGFHCMKWQGILLLSPPPHLTCGLDVSPLQS